VQGRALRRRGGAAGGPARRGGADLAHDAACCARVQAANREGAERERSERAVREKRERSEGGGGGWKSQRARGARFRVGAWAPSGPAGCVVFFKKKFRNDYLKSSKSHKNSPKMFINRILIFRLIITIFLNYYLITSISFKMN
jgi:hypothetical protein